MPRPKGSTNRASKSIKDRIERAFRRMDDPATSGLKHDMKQVSWLEYQARNNPAVFAGLVAKVIPTNVSVDITHGVDLGAALLQANARAETALQVEHDKPDMIDVTPIENIKDCKD